MEGEEEDGWVQPSVAIYENGRIHVRDKACDKCLFGKERLVDGRRAREIVTNTRRQVGGSFVCHRSQLYDEHDAICAVWFERFAQEDVVLRLAVAMGVIERVGETSGVRDQSGVGDPVGDDPALGDDEGGAEQR